MKILHPFFFLISFFITLFFFSGLKAEQLYDIRSLATKKEKIFNLSEPNKFFTGRGQEIEEINHALLNTTENQSVFVIVGVSGIGKTQLAKKYAYSSLDKYDFIWWFEGGKNLEAQVDELLKAIYQRKQKPYYRPANPMDLIKKFRYELEVIKTNWLIVFDNVNDISSINQYTPFKSKDSFSKHIIVTSKQMQNTYPSLVIHKFQRAESLVFLRKILEGEKEEDLNELAKTLGDFPLALAQAASYIKMNPSINIKTYLQLFKESLSELWKSEEKFIEGKKPNQSLNDNYNKTISTAIKMNINSIKGHSPLAYEMLCFCSLLSHQHIPLEVLERWACGKHGVSKIEFHEALSLLLNNFLLEKEIKEDKKVDVELFNQHELIQLITASTINKDKRGMILKEAAECILQELVNSPETLFEQFKGREHFYNHIEKICHLAEEVNYSESRIIELRIALLYFIHFIQRDFNKASELMKRLKDLSPQKNNDLSPLAKLWFYSTLVNDQMFEDFSKVKENYSKALDLVGGIKDKETKNSYSLHLNVDYVQSLSNFGKLKEALSLCDSLKETIKTTENKSQKTAFLGISGLIRLRYGQYDQCLKDVDSCLELISMQKDSAEYVPITMLIKAHCLLYLGQIKKAYKIIEEYYPLLLDVFTSPDNTVLVNAKLVKGACLSSLGRTEEALDIIQKTLSSYENTIGYENDSVKGMGCRILGEIFETKGDLAKAHTEYMKAESLYNKILQEKNLDELSLLYMRLAILGAKQRDDTMVKQYLDLHIKNFGLSHPRTFEIKHFLDKENLSLP